MAKTTTLGHRLFLPTLAVLASGLAATMIWATRAAAGPTPVARWDGFSGPVDAAPRPVEYVLGSGGSGGGLVRVPCAGGGTASCWVARP